MNRLEQHSTLSRLYALQLEVFPEHEDFLSRRIANSSDEHLVELEHLAQVGGLDLAPMAPATAD